MSKSIVEAKGVYRSAGPYTQAVQATTGRTIYTSGVLGRDIDGKLVGVGDAAAQTRQCIRNIQRLIESAGGRLDNLAKLTVFLLHPKHYEAMNAVRKELLTGIAFTSTTVVAQLIDPDGLVEMDAVAVIDE